MTPDMNQNRLTHLLHSFERTKRYSLTSARMLLGICSYAYAGYGTYQWMKDAFKAWPHFSGSDTYPVPDPSGQLDPGVAYGTLDKWSGPYGQMRKALLDFLIHRAKEQGGVSSEPEIS